MFNSNFNTGKPNVTRQQMANWHGSRGELPSGKSSSKEEVGIGRAILDGIGHALVPDESLRNAFWDKWNRISGVSAQEVEDERKRLLAEGYTRAEIDDQINEKYFKGKNKKKEYTGKSKYAYNISRYGIWLAGLLGANYLVNSTKQKLDRERLRRYLGADDSVDLDSIAMTGDDGKDYTVQDILQDRGAMNTFKNLATPFFWGRSSKLGDFMMMHPGIKFEGMKTLNNTIAPTTAVPTTSGFFSGLFKRKANNTPTEEDDDDDDDDDADNKFKLPRIEIRDKAFPINKVNADGTYRTRFTNEKSIPYKEPEAQFIFDNNNEKTTVVQPSYPLVPYGTFNKNGEYETSKVINNNAIEDDVKNASTEIFLDKKEAKKYPKRFLEWDAKRKRYKFAHIEVPESKLQLNFNNVHNKPITLDVKNSYDDVVNRVPGKYYEFAPNFWIDQKTKIKLENKHGSLYSNALRKKLKELNYKGVTKYPFEFEVKGYGYRKRTMRRKALKKRTKRSRR